MIIYNDDDYGGAAISVITAGKLVESEPSCLNSRRIRVNHVSESYEFFNQFMFKLGILARSINMIHYNNIGKGQRVLKGRSTNFES